MKKLIRVDANKLREERSALEYSLRYWQKIDESHSGGNPYAKENIAISRSKIEMIDFVLRSAE